MTLHKSTNIANTDWIYWIIPFHTILINIDSSVPFTGPRNPILVTLRDVFHPRLRICNTGIGHEDTQQALRMTLHRREEVFVILVVAPEFQHLSKQRIYVAISLQQQKWPCNRWASKHFSLYNNFHNETIPKIQKTSRIVKTYIDPPP